LRTVEGRFAEHKNDIEVFYPVSPARPLLEPLHHPAYLRRIFIDASAALARRPGDRPSAAARFVQAGCDGLLKERQHRFAQLPHPEQITRVATHCQRPAACTS